MSWKNLKIRTKLTLAFGSVLLLIVLISSIALFNFNQIGKTSATINNELLPVSIISNKISLSAYKIASLNQTFSNFNDKDLLEEDRKLLDSVKHYLKLAKELTENYSKTVDLNIVIANSERSLSEYEYALTGMESNVQKVTDNKAQLQKIKNEFENNCKKYSEYQSTMLKAEIKKNVSQFKINDRLKKIETFTSAYEKGEIAFNLLINGSSVKENISFQLALSSLSEVEHNLDELISYSGKYESSQISLVKQNITDGKGIANTNLLSFSELQKFNQTSSSFSNALISNFTAISNNNLVQSKAQILDSQNSSQFSLIALIIGLLAIFSLTILFTIVISKGLTASIKKGILFAKQVSEGKLDAKFEISQNDEIGQLAIALNQMTIQFNAVITEVISESDRINFESNKLTEDSAEIYNNLNNQEIVTEMVSISIEQIIKNTKQIKVESNESEQILSKIEEIKNNSGTSVYTSNSMEQVIEKIRSVLHTNILALNAMVETAFAANQTIIALEVSKLVEKSKFAADEICKLSKNEVTDSESIKMKLEAIIPELEKIAKFINKHSSITNLDNQNLKELKFSMQQHNTLSQQNINSSENIADSSDRISIISERLKNLVSFFKIAEIPAIIKTKNVPKIKLSDIKPKSIANKAIAKPIEITKVQDKVKQKPIEMTDVISVPISKVEEVKEITNEENSKEEIFSESIKVIDYNELEKEVYEEEVLETH